MSRWPWRICGRGVLPGPTRSLLRVTNEASWAIENASAVLVADIDHLGRALLDMGDPEHLSTRHAARSHAAVAGGRLTEAHDEALKRAGVRPPDAPSAHSMAACAPLHSGDVDSARVESSVLERLDWASADRFRFPTGAGRQMATNEASGIGAIAGRYRAVDGDRWCLGIAGVRTWQRLHARTRGTPVARGRTGRRRGLAGRHADGSRHLVRDPIPGWPRGGRVGQSGALDIRRPADELRSLIVVRLGGAFGGESDSLVGHCLTHCPCPSR